MPKVSIQDKYTEVPRKSVVQYASTIYQDRNLDLPWKGSAKDIALAAWPDIDFTKSVAALGTEVGDFPVKFIARWDLAND